MKPADDDVLLALTRTVSDDSPVDWERFEALAREEPRKGVVVQLKTIAAVAKVHRQGSDDGPEHLPRRWGDLELRQVLGEGAFGRVYCAWDPNLEREVALKLMRASEARGLQEARSMARVRHPNVVLIHGVDRREGQVGLEMERIRGRTLEALLREQGPFGAREAALIGVEITKAAAAVHNAGLVHRDIKAQNVMREEGGRIVLMDFGLGSKVDSQESSGSGLMAGTPPYMAPELVRGGESTVASDIYAIGVLLYRLVTGSYPVHARSMEEVRRAYEQGRVQLLRDCRPDLPVQFVQVVERALAPDWKDRFATAGAMERALLLALGSVETAPLRYRIGRRILLWAAILALVVLLAVGLVKFRQEPASVAVLPFVNVSADPEMEYFSDGITEELINALGRVKDLRVVARSSAFQFKGRTDRVKEIGERLKVRSVVSGSVRRSGDRLRITAEMLNTGDGYRVWSETYERELKDIFAIQDDIARTISANLRVQLAGGALAQAGTRTANLEAYDAYLKGRFHWNKRNSEGLKKGLDYFERAIAADPYYALAYAGISDSYSVMVDYGFMTPGEAMPKAKAAALKALSINGGLAEAHASFALVSTLYDWDWYNAEQSFRQALAISPGFVTAHQWYGTMLMKTGRLNEAIAEARRALELDPLSVPVTTFLSALYLFSRQYDLSIEQAQRVLELNPSYFHAHNLLAHAYARKGMREQALEACRTARSLSADYPLTLRYCATAMAILGMRNEALEVLRVMEEKRQQRDFQVSYLALVYAALGEKDRAFELLEKAYEDRDSSLLYLRPDLCYDSLRSDPRYGRLLSKLKIPPG